MNEPEGPAEDRAGSKAGTRAKDTVKNPGDSAPKGRVSWFANLVTDMGAYAGTVIGIAIGLAGLAQKGPNKVAVLIISFLGSILFVALIISRKHISPERKLIKWPIMGLLALCATAAIVAALFIIAVDDSDSSENGTEQTQASPTPSTSRQSTTVTSSPVAEDIPVEWVEETHFISGPGETISALDDSLKIHSVKTNREEIQLRLTSGADSCDASLGFGEKTVLHVGTYGSYAYFVVTYDRIDGATQQSVITTVWTTDPDYRFTDKCI